MSKTAIASDLAFSRKHSVAADNPAKTKDAKLNLKNSGLPRPMGSQ